MTRLYMTHGPVETAGAAPARLYLNAGSRVEFAATTVAENGDPAATVTSHMGCTPSWASQTASSDPSLPAGAAASTGRITVQHTKGRCHMRRVVTAEARDRAYRAALAAGRTRISLLDLTD
jgi:hypothetical protein